MEIRTFRAPDTEAVVGLWRDCGLTRPWNDPHRDLARKVADSPWGLLVGDRAGTVIASVMVGYDGHRGSINYLAVAPEHQGRGHGANLMAHAEALLRDRGCPKINLQVRGDNAGVIGFYRRRGYHVAGAGDFADLGLRLIPDGPG